MAFILESGAMRGKIIPAGKMIAYIWRGMQVVKCPPSEIHMPLTERAAEHRKSWSESGRIWKRYDLPKQGLWNAAAGAVGSATSNIAGVKTPEKTHQAAEELSAHLQEHNKARLQRQHQPAKVEPPTLPP